MTTILSSSDTGTIFGSGSTTLGLLDIARDIAPDGAPGLSSRARQLNNQFLSQSSSNANNLFSSTSSSAYLSVEDLQTQIKAIRASLPDSALASDLVGNILDEEA